MGTGQDPSGTWLVGTGERSRRAIIEPILVSDLHTSNKAKPLKQPFTNCVSWPNRSRPSYAPILSSYSKLFYNSSSPDGLPALLKHDQPGAYGSLHPKHVPAVSSIQQCVMAVLSVPRHKVRFHSAASNGPEYSGIGAH